MKPYQDKDFLEKKYEELKYTSRIAKDLGVSDDTIEYWRKKHNIIKPETIASSRKHYFREDFFEKIDSEEKAYWLGFIMADGCVCKSGKNGNPNTLRITLKKSDREQLESFNKSLKSDYIIKEKTLYDKRGFTSESATLKINSVKICNDLQKYGVIQKKTGKEIVPDIDKNLIRHYIRGYFDGDGSITFSKANKSASFKICSASLVLIQDIATTFEDLGMKINYQTYNNNFYILETRKQSNILSLKKYLYDDSTIYLNRKFQKISQICANFKKVS